MAVSAAMVHKSVWGQPRWYCGKKYPRDNKEVEKLKMEAPSKSGMKELMKPHPVIQVFTCMGNKRTFSIT